jgi:hypothetical protein
MKVNIGRYPKGDKERKISVQIDKWDTWSADHTLALIIAPLLQKMKEDKQGSPKVDDADVPEHLKRTAVAPTENEWDTDDNWHPRWDYVLDEMLWAMQQIASNNETDDQFFDDSEVDESKSVMDQIHAIKVDREGLKAHQDRIQKGCELFGKYFQALWS